MSCLQDSSELATGDPIFCTKCKAILNKYSQIEEVKEESKQIWACEFCNEKNTVQLEEEEKPKSDTVNYIIEAAAQVKDKKEEETKKSELAKDISVVYCVDVSGSMGHSRGGPSRL